jgi:hypothetical protein
MARERHPSNTTTMRAPFFLAAAIAVLGCSSGANSLGALVPIAHVAPAPPPKDDGKAAKGGEGGGAHSGALEQLRQASAGPRVDKQNSMRIWLPDAARWTRVKFWGVPTLVGFRYGKDHHAIVAGFITHVEDNLEPGACEKSFHEVAMPWLESFEVEVQYEPATSVHWEKHSADITSITAKTATLAEHDTYAAAYAMYPAWKGACLVVGVAVPARDDLARAKEVRDRFVREVFPKLEVTAPHEPKERFCEFERAWA